MVAFAGMDPLKYLYEGNAERRALMAAVAVQHERLVLDLNDDLAVKIINKLGEAMK